MIHLENVSKTFSGKIDQPVTALEKINISIAAGEFIVIDGPSGSGKSTLLFTIGGMQKPSKGKVVFKQDELYALSPSKRSVLRNRSIGFVFQTFNLISYLNSVENVVFPALIAGQPVKDAQQKAHTLLKNLGLEKRMHHKPAQLSVGERQRVAICRSLINSPDVILADEPTGNMDPALTSETMNIFKTINAAGQTIIMVTHDPELAGIGSRHIRLVQGSIEKDAPPTER